MVGQPLFRAFLLTGQMRAGWCSRVVHVPTSPYRDGLGHILE